MNLESKMNNESVTIKRKSTDLSGILGYLYDARKEKVISMSIFGKDLPRELIESQETNNTDFKFDFSDSNEEKFKKLNIEAELKCDILCGMVKLEGSGIDFVLMNFCFDFMYIYTYYYLKKGKYLDEEKKSHRSVKGSLFYKLRTKKENISISKDEIQKLVSTKTLDTKGKLIKLTNSS